MPLFDPSIQQISAGTTHATGPRVVFANSNGVSFGVSGQTVTASAVGGAGGGVAISAAGNSVSTGTVEFANSHNITFGMAGSTITGSASYPAQTSSSLVYSNANNVSFGIAGSTLTATASFPAQSSAFFSDSNNVSFGLVGSTWTATASFPSAIPFAIADSISTVTNGTIVFSNANGVSFGLSGSTVTAAFNAAGGAVLKAVMTTGSTAVANTETVLTSFTIPANTLQVGDVISFTASGSRSGADATSPTFRVRIGPTTLTGTVVITQANLTTVNPGGHSWRGEITITSIGATGTVNGESQGSINSAGTNTVVINNGRIDAAVIDTTVANLCEITFISGTGTNTYTFRTAVLYMFPINPTLGGGISAISGGGTSFAAANSVLNFSNANGVSWGLASTVGSQIVATAAPLQPGSALVTTAGIAIANTETVVTSFTMPSGGFAIGDLFAFEAWCGQAGINAAQPTIRIRIGTTTLTGVIVTTLGGIAGSSGAFSSVFRGTFEIITLGATGSAGGQVTQAKGGATTVGVGVTAPQTIDTTVSNLVELTFISGNAANTYTFFGGWIRRITRQG